jgi:disulfide bond formation protein DsbB
MYMQDLTPFVNSLNYYLSLCSVIATVVLALYVIYLGMLYTAKKTTMLTECVSKYILPLGFLVSLGGMLMSLYYSEFLHIVACDLCWYQRIFMYSQVFIFGYAWYKKDTHILPYSLLLSLVGIAIAIYHHLLQIGFSLYKPCSTAPFAADCSKPTFVEFGFVTFPYMAVVLFATLILLVITNKYFAKR